MRSDREKSGGFLNKVFDLMRSKNPSGADALQEASPEGLSVPELLQEKMSRKRRNEAIRRHEFMQLRLKRNSVDLGEVQSESGERLSSLFGQDSQTNETLQKINTIEAQMASQWWQSQHSGENQPLLNGKPVSAPKPPHIKPISAVAPSVLATSEAKEKPVVPLKNAPITQQTSSVPSAAPEFRPLPEIEEAAILFAHGAIEDARARLLELLVQRLNEAPRDENAIVVIWHSVLDLCRATGNEEAFETLAIDYAEHFGRSAPMWFSIPERLNIPPLSGAARSKKIKRNFQWSSPVVMTEASVGTLQQTQKEASFPWSMSLRRLKDIELSALQPFIALVQQWASNEGQFVLSDAGKLLQLLQEKTPLKESSVSPHWWMLRMAMLRWIDRADEYEQVALDYCITYEVSPPSWEPPVCQCVVQEEGEADVSTLQGASAVSGLQHASTGSSTVATPDTSGLVGVIEGDSQPWLDALTQQATAGKELVISCRNLIRVDFVAAGGILNWAAQMQGQGYTLRFTQLHQLVAVFFYVIGIQEHAKVETAIL